jgi:hypothetical protein
MVVEVVALVVEIVMLVVVVVEVVVLVVVIVIWDAVSINLKHNPSPPTARTISAVGVSIVHFWALSW